jgi:hypothetical protein
MQQLERSRDFNAMPISGLASFRLRGYTVRIVAGNRAVGTPISIWYNQIDAG